MLLPFFVLCLQQERRRGRRHTGQEKTCLHWWCYILCPGSKGRKIPVCTVWCYVLCPGSKGRIDLFALYGVTFCAQVLVVPENEHTKAIGLQSF
jgi:hypothetical protein